MSRTEAQRRRFIDEKEKIKHFCIVHHLALHELGRGYQLRIGGVIDIYPVNKRWHYLKTGQRGSYDDINDLDLSIFNRDTIRMGDYTPHESMLNEVSPFERNQYIPPLDIYRLEHPNTKLKPKRHWWQFWKRG